MENKVKTWIEYEYKCVKTSMSTNHPYSVVNAIHRCYGVLMFSINNLFDDYNEELAKWWDDEMLPKFRELGRK